MTKREYEITPDVSLMEDIGATSFTVPEAIVELIANSFDARLEGSPVIIEIDVSPKAIHVIDNAQGMPENILAEAIRLSVKMDEIIKRTGEKKGMFGLGMKTACASMGRYWSVHTRPIGSDLEYFVEFDLSKWSGRNRSHEQGWRAFIHSGPHKEDSPLGGRAHGTAITIKKLRESNPLAGAVLSKVGAAYRPHIEQGDTIIVNREKAHPPSYNLIPGSMVEIDEVCGVHRITGWVGLDVKIHNDDFFGLNLYRKGQLLAPWDKSWFAVHLMTSRIMGEINLDFVPPNFHKKGFETQSKEWKEAEKVMRNVMKPVVSASRTASKGKNKPMKFAKAAQALQDALGTPEARDAIVTPAVADGEDGAQASTGGGGSKEISIDADSILLPEGKVRVSSIIRDLNDPKVPWSYMWDSQENMVQAVINEGSLIFQKTNDEGMITILGLADCILQFLVEEKGLDARKAWHIRNGWLYERTNK